MCVFRYCENQNWTPLCYATLSGNVRIAKFLLERGAKVDGGVSLTDFVETPLQIAAGTGNSRMAELLMSFGASPFKSTTAKETDDSSPMMLLPTATQNGCLSPISGEFIRISVISHIRAKNHFSCPTTVCSSHGHRRLLHIMITQSLQYSKNGAGNHHTRNENDVLSLEEILAEGAAPTEQHESKEADLSRRKEPVTADQALVSKLSKPQVKKLQEAMYNASESGNIELTLDLRNMGVPWTLYTWIQTLKTAHDGQILSVVNELLQDFSVSWLDEQPGCFVDLGLPLLFSLFKTCKNEGTILLLADIFSSCYTSRKSTNHKIELHVHASDEKELGGPRIDPKFINNPELSDVQFKVKSSLQFHIILYYIILYYITAHCVLYLYYTCWSALQPILRPGRGRRAGSRVSETPRKKS